MARPIDKKAVYEAYFPKGTIIELIEPIDDLYSPKPAGARFKVSEIDDQFQLQGLWLPPESGSLAVDIEHDKYKRVL